MKTALKSRSVGAWRAAPVVSVMALFAGSLPAEAVRIGGAEGERSGPVIERTIAPAMIQMVAPVQTKPLLVRVAEVGRGNEMKWEPSFDRAPTRTFVAKERTIQPMLAPDTVKNIQLAIARYQIIVNRGGWPKVPSDRVIGVSSYGDHVVALRSRLTISGDIEAKANKDPKAYDAEMIAAVRKFQTRHGLKSTGIVAGDTLRELNVSANKRLMTLQANSSRIGPLTKKLGARYVIVNIPAAQVESVEDGFVHSRHNAVVGMADRPTPVLASRVHQLNFNPFWHVPVSIVEKDLLPKIRKDRNFLAKMNMRVYQGGYGGKEVDVSKIDWAKVRPNQYLFRQDPGKSNAMASVKINFPNKHAVYLHDTPTKSLFGRAERFFSSGCVRVEKVQLLLEWLLQGDKSWDRKKIDKMATTGDRLDVSLKRSVPIRMVYLTAWATREGTVSFREDLYDRDIKFAATHPRAGEPTVPLPETVAAVQPAKQDSTAVTMKALEPIRQTAPARKPEPAMAPAPAAPSNEAMLPGDDEDLASRATGRIDTSLLDDDFSEDEPAPMPSERAETVYDRNWPDDQDTR